MFGLPKKKNKTDVPKSAPSDISVGIGKGTDVFTVEPVEKKQKVRLLFPSDRPILSKASFFVKIALLLISLMLLLASVKLVMDYTRMVEEAEQKQERYEEIQDRIDELNYYISSPMDEYYVRKFAWEIFHMVPSDKKVVIVPEN